MTDFILPFASFRPSPQGLCDLKSQTNFRSLNFEDDSQLIFCEQRRQFLIKKEKTSVPIAQWLNFPIILYLLVLRGN